MSRIAILGQSMKSGARDFGLMYTPATWTFGWMTRVLAQVAFYSMMGTLLNDPDRTRYLLIGAAIYIAVVETMVTTASTTWERVSGTLPLLIAAPAGLVLVFSGRSWCWVATGTLSSTLSMLIMAPIFGVSLSLTQAIAVIPLIFLVSLTTYGLALSCGSLAARFHPWRNVISNVVHLTMLGLGGFLVPVAFWPIGLQWLAQVFPATHGLAAVRTVLDAGPAWTVAGHAIIAALVGIAWALVAMWSFWWLAASGRRTGAIEYGDL